MSKSTDCQDSATTPKLGVRRRQKRRSLPDRVHLPQVQDRVSQIPRLYKSGYLRAVTAQASAKGAIKAQCLECVGWVRRDVAECTALACPLWLYRPFKGARE
jgi:hypothetical protein